MWYNRMRGVLGLRLQLYLHFPFCKRKCQYCDFCSAAPRPGEMEAYADELVAEIRREGAVWPGAEVTTVFLGGGTPSLFPAPLMARVLAALREAFAILPNAEMTSEANPGVLTADWLDVLRVQGFCRLSLGMQARQERLLALLGRVHRWSDVEQAVAMARRAGFASLNLDVMTGLPTQTAAEVTETLQAAAALGAEHLSIYSLIVEDGTPLKDKLARGEWTLPDEDTLAAIDAAVAAETARNGYERYEISNYAKQGYECRHNLGYWQGEWYLGLGVAAHSLLPPEQGEQWRRCRNTESLDEYLRQTRQGESPRVEMQRISPREAMFETMMLGLRTVQGVSGPTFAARFGQTLDERYGAALSRLEREGLLYRTLDGGAALTARGLDVENDVALRFMDDFDLL